MTIQELLNENERTTGTNFEAWFKEFFAVDTPLQIGDQHFNINLKNLEDYPSIKELLLGKVKLKDLSVNFSGKGVFKCDAKNNTSDLIIKETGKPLSKFKGSKSGNYFELKSGNYSENKQIMFSELKKIASKGAIKNVFSEFLNDQDEIKLNEWFKNWKDSGQKAYKAELNNANDLYDGIVKLINNWFDEPNNKSKTIKELEDYLGDSYWYLTTGSKGILDSLVFTKINPSNFINNLIVSKTKWSGIPKIKISIKKSSIKEGVNNINEKFSNAITQNQDNTMYEYTLEISPMVVNLKGNFVSQSEYQKVSSIDTEKVFEGFLKEVRNTMQS